MHLTYARRTAYYLLVTSGKRNGAINCQGQAGRRRDEREGERGVTKWSRNGLQGPYTRLGFDTTYKTIEKNFDKNVKFERKEGESNGN